MPGVRRGSNVRLAPLRRNSKREDVLKIYDSSVVPPSSVSIRASLPRRWTRAQ